MTKISKTARGFAIKTFTDYYGSECSLQKSSLADIDCVWLGVTRPFTEPQIANQTRMHLTRPMVKKLLPLLEKFVRTGELE
jgi:hypothetical protein